ncbi:manganese/zinc/iron transport system permease protein [Micrococcales bacterium KH10]|nr:manganese/zinc/iron transport system permease protein [Micrococcales bacterium KH10]
MTPAEFFTDHTFRTVFLGTTMIGLVAGALGTFAYLRKQSMIGDVISHAALPGALGGFLIAVTVLGIDGRNMAVLTAGALVTGTLAAWLTQLISRRSVLRVDTAMAVTLTGFFGVGMIAMRVITNGDYPGKGGIQDYLFGNASVLTRADLITIGAVGLTALVVTMTFWRPFAMHAFDQTYAASQGDRTHLIDTVMFGVLAVATVIGVKAVGLVLMVAILITPAAIARQWTSSLRSMTVTAGGVGAVTSGFGAYLSVSLGNVPTGPLVVVCLFVLLVLSVLFAPGRSLLLRAWRRRRLRRALRDEIQTGDSQPRPLAWKRAVS